MHQVRVIGLLLLIIVLGLVGDAAAAQKPNVLIVLVDDQGYGDLSCHGNPVLKTPHIDALHGQSVRLTDFHVSPMCTPTRSQLMTGHDALENGAMNVSSGRTMLRRGIPTMADVFRSSGYRTALFGKWHLGDVYPYRPQDRGFEKAIWFPSSHIPAAPDYWNNDYFDTRFRLEDGSVKQFPGYCTDVLFDETMAWMKQRHETGEPFFAYLALNSAHGPLFVPDKYREPFRNLPPRLASFYGMIVNIDENMGRLETMLRQSGLRDNTIVIFMTDNGGTAGVAKYNAGMKAGKVTLWEGGHRVPCFIRWPEGRLGQARDIDQLTHVQDMLPTLIELCGLKAPSSPQFDGVSLAPLLRGQPQDLAERMLVVQFSRMNRPVPLKGDATVMWGKWRLVGDGESWALYDVGKNLAQERDIAQSHPGVAAKMREHYEAWWGDIEPRVNEFSRIPIGTDAEPVTLLSAADWQDVFLDQQFQVRNGLNRSGPWGIEVTRDGEYTFELRRWPREADVALSAGVPPFKAVDGVYGEGKRLPIAKAKLRIGDRQWTQDAKDGDKAVRFTVPLKRGDLQAQTWFYDAEGNELAGAYYVYVERQR